jgi:hypothetical protein
VRAYRILLLLLASGAALLTAAPAMAEPYPASPPITTVNQGTVSAGRGVVFSGSGYGAGEAITITVVYANGETATINVVADANGNFSTTVQLTQAGTATLTATGQTTHVVSSANVQVVAGPPPPGDGGGLPVTGAPRSRLVGQLVTGASAVLLGTGLLWVTMMWRRRGVKRA